MGFGQFKNDEPISSPVVLDQPKQKQTLKPKVKFDFTGYKGKNINFKEYEGKFNPEIQKEIFNQFEDLKLSTPAAAVAITENIPLNLKAVHKNKPVEKKGIDYGLFQINDKTLIDTLRFPKWRRALEKKGVDVSGVVSAMKEEDKNKLNKTIKEVLFDPINNVRIARVLVDRQLESGLFPFAWWFGWKDRKVNLKDKVDKKYRR